MCVYTSKIEEIPLAILSRILAQSCMRNHLPKYMLGGVTHECVDSIAKGISLFPRFFALCILSIHPHSFN